MTDHEHVTPDAEHQRPDLEPSVCWLLDVRRYGLATANALHPQDES